MAWVSSLSMISRDWIIVSVSRGCRERKGKGCIVRVNGGDLHKKGKKETSCWIYCKGYTTDNTKKLGGIQNFLHTQKTTHFQNIKHYLHFKIMQCCIIIFCCQQRMRFAHNDPMHLSPLPSNKRKKKPVCYVTSCFSLLTLLLAWVHSIKMFLCSINTMSSMKYNAILLSAHYIT